MKVKMNVKFRKVYDDHSRLSIATEGPSLTTQDCKDECDINYIIESYVKRGLDIPQGGSYIDCTTVQDYESAAMLVAECKSNFEQLPSSIRDEFKTVENYLAYISNENNLKDCVDRGLIDKSTVPEDVLNSLYKDLDTNSSETSNPLPENPVNNSVSDVGQNVSANS